MNTAVKVGLAGCAGVASAAVVVAVVGTVVAFTWGRQALETTLGRPEGAHGRALQALTTTRPFTPPPDGRLTESQVRRFLGVCRVWAERREKDAAEFDRAVRGMSGRDVSSVEGYLFWLKVGNGMRDAFVAGLQAEQMSLEEYRFVHRAVGTAALAMANEAVAPQLSALPQDLPLPPDMARSLDAVRQQVGSAPPENVRLLAPFKAELERYLPVAPRALMLFPLLVEVDETDPTGALW